MSAKMFPLQSPYVKAVSGVDLGPFVAIPRALFQHPRFRKPNGKPHRLAIEIYAALLAWYRPLWVSEVDPETGREEVRVYQRFPGQMFRVNYKAWARWLYGDETATGPVKRAVAFLKRQGLIRFVLHPRQGPDGRLVDNVPYIAPDIDALREIFALEQYANPPADLFEAVEVEGESGSQAKDASDEAGTPEPAPEPAPGAEMPHATHASSLDAPPAPSRQKLRDGASFLASPSRNSARPSRKTPRPSRAKLRDLNKESFSTKNPIDKKEPTPPPSGEGGVGGGGNQKQLENILQKLGVPGRYRRSLADRLAGGQVTWADVAAEWARVYAAEGLRRPAAVAAANLVRGDLPEPEWYRRPPPEHVRDILRQVGFQHDPEAPDDEMQAELEALRKLLEVNP